MIVLNSETLCLLGVITQLTLAARLRFALPARDAIIIFP